MTSTTTNNNNNNSNIDSSCTSMIHDIEEIHLSACKSGSTTYTDPDSGLTVFTELAHLKRGKCCGSQCRHCPYGWEKVRKSKNQAVVGTRPMAKLQSGDKAAARSLFRQLRNYGTTTPALAPSSVSSSSGSSSESETDIPTSVTTTTTTTTAKTEPTTIVSKKKKTGGRHGGNLTSKNVPYTRTGDKGTSTLLTGERRAKNDELFEAMGTVDELCSVVGVCHATLISPTTTNTNISPLDEWLLEIMSRLFDIGTVIAKNSGGKKNINNNKEKEIGLGIIHVQQLEDWIDILTEQLPELSSFILPTGHVTSAHLHVARTVCRRAERSMVDANVDDENSLMYVNRLSDFFFTAARFINHSVGQAEILYKRPTRSSKQRELTYQQHEK